MTSLARQLEALSSAVTEQLGVDLQHPSLLFEKKEAAALDRETVFKIGCAGFTQLKTLDKEFKKDNELFEETSIDAQRLLMNRQENTALGEKIERFLVRLLPYLQHFAAQQALEWLIYKYHIHSYNAEFIIANFLPFHESNIFGRLLGTLQYNFSSSKDWYFIADFAKRRQHIPFNALVKHAHSGSHSLVSRIISQMERSLELVGEDYLESKCPIIFSFLAKLLLETLSPSHPIDDSLLSKIIPILANGIRSKLLSFRLSSLMVVCQLSIGTKLTHNTVHSILKLLIMKLRPETLKESLTTIVVMTQQQTVDSFSSKAMCKLLKREDLRCIATTMQILARQSNLSAFFSALWNSLYSIIADPELADCEASAVILLTASLDSLTGPQFTVLLEKTLAHVSDDRKLPSKMHDEFHALAARYSDEFNTVYKEWKIKDSKALKSLVSSCDLQELIIVDGMLTKKKKKTESVERMEVDEEKPVIILDPLSVALEAAATMGEVVLKREKFSGDPIKKCMGWIGKKEWDKVSWAVEEMSSRVSYLQGQLEEDLEDLFIELLRVTVERPKGFILDGVRDLMGMIPLSEKFILELLEKHDGEGSCAKKGKKMNGSGGSGLEKYFNGENEESWHRRLILTLQALQLTPKLKASNKLLTILFDFVVQMNVMETTENVHSILQGSIAVLLRLLQQPGGYSIESSDLRMDCVVDGMRATLSHHLLRDALRLLTAAVRVSPKSVVSHVLSIFTFMGAGLLKKDNELTLSIMEDTLNALFTAVVSEGKKTDMEQRLVSVCKIFSASINDIPAHRRARAARSIARAVGEVNVGTVMEVMVEGYCAKWQRSTQGDTRSTRNGEQDAYEDMASELLSAFPAVTQLSILLDVISFILRLGGDHIKKQSDRSVLDRSIFDRSAQSLPRLRHFRFLLLGVVVRVLSKRSLYEELASSSDSSLLISLLPIARRLLSSSVDLDEFSSSESTNAESAEGEGGASLRYWIAFASRAEVVADKLRHLMPGGVAAQLITAILKDTKTDGRLREKALQLANVKLLTEGGFCVDREENDRHLNALAETMNPWIHPAKTADKIVLCQNAAFSLKLIAKHLRPTADSTVLTATMENCTNTLKEWSSLDETLVGNMLLLAGELIRSHNMSATLLSAHPLINVCCAILQEILTAKNEERLSVDSPSSSTPVPSRRQRIRQQSLCGRRLGSDTMLICALTCTQRILDHLGRFVTSSLHKVTVLIARLAPRFGLVGGKELEGVEKTRDGRGSIEFRLQLIRKSLLSLDARIVLPAVMEGAKEVKGEEKPLSWLLSLLTSSFTQADRSWLVKQESILLDGLFRPLLQHRSEERRVEQLESISSLESAVFECFNAFAENVTEIELRPLMSSLVEWAESGLRNGASLQERLRLPTIFHLANSLYSSFNTLSLVYFGRLFEIASKTFTAVNYSTNSSPLFSLRKGAADVSHAEVHFLLVQLLLFVQNCARQPRFFSSDRWELIRSPLVDELENTKVEGHESRCLSLADSLYPALECHSDTLGDTLQAIMEKVREGSAKHRYRCLLVVERLTGRIGEGMAPHLPLLMPFLSELMEDDNRAVEEQTEKVVRLLQKKFGEDISEGFV